VVADADSLVGASGGGWVRGEVVTSPGGSGGPGGRGGDLGAGRSARGWARSLLDVVVSGRCGARSLLGNEWSGSFGARSLLETEVSGSFGTRSLFAGAVGEERWKGLTPTERQR
jgi:hypothetical protein